MNRIPAFDIVASNVRGLGAIQLAQSLMPAMERVAGDALRTVWLPSDGALHGYRGVLPDDRYVPFQRSLPNALSRVTECLWPGRIYPPERALIVLGDLPLRHRGRQIVFAHRPHLVRGVEAGSTGSAITAAISQRIFALNQGYIDHLVVQTEAMQAGLVRTFPAIAGRTHIIAQPAPEWLLSNPIVRTGRADSAGAAPLRLFFPAAIYPHKNHQLLFRYVADAAPQSPSVEITLTCDLPAGMTTNPRLNFVGRLDPEGMRVHYRTTDALLFPSLEESYGLPLVEAILMGLPVICADLPYARALCGEGAVYFDPHSTGSLTHAIGEMQARLDRGEWPNWSNQRTRFPPSWDAVAEAMIELVGR
jgi:glycosyltransferase involved in cell wall biosynthesis